MVRPSPLSAAGSFALHASAVITPSGAALFSGPSRTGKSTIAALLSAHLEWPILADDTTRLLRREGRWVAEHALLAGWIAAGCGDRWPLCRERDVPVAAWFTIRQAPSVACTPSRTRATCVRMIEAWTEASGEGSRYNPICALRAFPQIADLARSVPAYVLDCTLGVETAVMVCETLTSPRQEENHG